MTTYPKTFPSAVLFLISTAFLFSIWTANPFGAVAVLRFGIFFGKMDGGPGDMREASNAVVRETVAQRFAGTAPSTFMLLPDPVRVREVSDFLGENHPRMGRSVAPYYSQFGFQADVAEWFARMAKDPIAGLAYFRLCLAVAAAVSASIFIVWVSRHAGLLSALAVLLVMGFSDWMIYLSQSVYFVLFLNLLAFSLPWIFLCSGTEVGRGKFLLFLLVHGALVFIRSLCGYEFITCLISAPFPAIVYSVLGATRPLPTLLQRTFLCGLIGVFSFGLAIGAHWSKAVLSEKLPPREALAFLAHRSKANTRVGLLSSDLANADRILKVAYPFYRTVNTLGLEGPSAALVFVTVGHVMACLTGHLVTLPGKFFISNGFFLAFVVVCAGWFGVRRKHLSNSPDYPLVEKWLAVTLAALVPSFSWYALAFYHSISHIFYVLICLFFAFVPVATVFCVRLILLEIERWRSKRLEH